MMRIIVAGFLGAIALMIWGFISWEVLPWSSQTMHALPNEDAVLAALKAGNIESGLYMIPGPKDRTDEAERKAHMEKMKAGPVAMINYSTTGMDMGSYMIRGFLVYFLSAMLAASLLAKLSWSLASKFGARVWYVTMLGIFLAVAARISDWAWMGASTSMSITLAINDIIGWTLAGLLIAWRMKPVMAKTA